MKGTRDIHVLDLPMPQCMRSTHKSILPYPTYETLSF